MAIHELNKSVQRANNRRKADIQSIEKAAVSAIRSVVAEAIDKMTAAVQEAAKLQGDYREIKIEEASIESLKSSLVAAVRDIKIDVPKLEQPKPAAKKPQAYKVNVEVNSKGDITTATITPTG